MSPVIYWHVSYSKVDNTEPLRMNNIIFHSNNLLYLHLTWNLSRLWVLLTSLKCNEPLAPSHYHILHNSHPWLVILQCSLPYHPANASAILLPSSQILSCNPSYTNPILLWTHSLCQVFVLCVGCFGSIYHIACMHLT